MAGSGVRGWAARPRVPDRPGGGGNIQPEIRRRARFLESEPDIGVLRVSTEGRGRA